MKKWLLIFVFCILLFGNQTKAQFFQGPNQKTELFGGADGPSRNAGDGGGGNVGNDNGPGSGGGDVSPLEDGVTILLGLAVMYIFKFKRKQN